MKISSNSIRKVRIYGILLGTIVPMLLCGFYLRAATIVVTSTADSGAGSLRSAIATANSLQGTNIINFAPSLSGRTISLTNGQLIISNQMTIDASDLPGGIIISGNYSNRVFTISSNALVDLNSLTVERGLFGRPTDSSPYLTGGGIENDYGATLTINNCTISENFASSGGGGIANFGVLTVNNSTISGNSAISNFGLGYGAGINNEGTLTVSNSVISQNTASDGSGGIASSSGTVIINSSIISRNSDGGIENASGTLTVNGSIISNNSSSSWGIGIYNYYGGSLTVNDSAISGHPEHGIYNNAGCICTVNNCTISNNIANGYQEIEGGGIENSGKLTINNSVICNNSTEYGAGINNWSDGIGADGMVTVNNSTISENIATSYESIGYGGGILNDGTLILNNCTICSNSAVGSSNDGGGIYDGTGVGAILILTNTIVAVNTAGSGANISGSFSGTHYLVGGNPLLGPLADNGGPTLTMAPLPGSPTIDAGDDSIANTLTRDQRGYPRLSGSHVDIGAVEAQMVPANSRPSLMNSAWSSVGGRNTFQFSFTNAADIDFTALASTNVALPLTGWTVLGNIPQISPGHYQFTDSRATNFPQCFYRVVSP